MGKSVPEVVAAMRRAPNNIRYADLYRVCCHYFGEPRQRATSHAVFRTPWPGDPRVNIQSDHGSAKRYQVLQVLVAIYRLESEQGGAS